MEVKDIIITSRAQTDISTCITFALNISKDASIKVAKEIFKSIESLKQFPERFPAFNMPNYASYAYRKMVINKRYIAIYSLEEDIIVIHRVLDGRRGYSSLVE